MLYGNNNNNNSKFLNAHIYLLLLSGIPRALETNMRDTVTLSSDLTSTTFQKKKIFIIQIIFLCAGLFLCYKNINAMHRNFSYTLYSTHECWWEEKNLFVEKLYSLCFFMFSLIQRIVLYSFSSTLSKVFMMKKGKEKKFKRKKAVAATERWEKTTMWERKEKFILTKSWRKNCSAEK